MNINIADNLRKLRRQREITQEELANFIGVSFQAVSKWERNEGYPDITILPVIANFFDISLDELVGMNEIKNKARLDEIFAKYIKNLSEGRIEENIDMLRKEIKCFPNNYELLSKLVSSLSIVQTDEETKKKYINEAIEICERILEYCTDNNIRNNIQSNLCILYHKNGEDDKAINQAKLLPDLWNCRDIISSLVLNGKELKQTTQKSIASLADAVRFQLSYLADPNYFYDFGWTNEERVSILDKGNKIFEIIYDDGDYNFYSCYIAETYRVMAALSLLDNKTEQALYYLDKAVAHTISFDNIPEKVKYTSLVVNTLVYDKKETGKNYSHNMSYVMLEKFKQGRYNCLRNDKRFINMEKKLKSNAK